jgi:hypothetical protein
MQAERFIEARCHTEGMLGLFRRPPAVELQDRGDGEERTGPQPCHAPFIPVRHG